MYGEEQRCIRAFDGEMRRGYFENLGIGGVIIPKWAFE
jgi:hypothetical protein